MQRFLFVVLLLVVCGFAGYKFRADITAYFVKDKKNSEIVGAASPITYLSMVVFDNDEVLELAQDITSRCKTHNKSCQIYKLFSYIKNNYKYIDDPEGMNVISGVSLTISKKGGDCEDLSILLASLLESLHIKTKMAFQEDHVYLYVCDIDAKQLYKEIKKDRMYAKRNVKVFTKQIGDRICIPVDPTNMTGYPGQKVSGEDIFVEDIRIY